MFKDDKIIQFLNLVFDEIFPNFSIDGYLQLNGITTRSKRDKNNFIELNRSSFMGG